MRENHYAFFVFTDGDWKCAMDRRLTKGSAGGLFNCFKSKYSVRVFRGVEAGKMVAAHYRPEDRPTLERTNFPQNVRDMDTLNC